MEYLLYLPEPVHAPTAPVLFSRRDPWREALLDENLNFLRCYAESGEKVPCDRSPENLVKEELVVVGGAAAEALASQLGALYVDERVVKLSEVYEPEKPETLFEASAEAINRRGESPILAGTLLVVLPGASAKAWAVGLAAQLRGETAELKAAFAFTEKMGTKFRKGEDWEPFQRFGSWWQVPWNYVFSSGKSLKRIVEVVVERPVSKLSSLPALARDPEEIVLEVARSISSGKHAVLGHRSPRKAVVYIDEGLYRPHGGYTAVVVSKNYQRRVIARWYFDKRFNLVAFDSAPPEAVRGVDAEIAVGDVPREVQARLTGSGAVLITRSAVLSPVKLEDYIAIKALRWFENAAL
uniref:Uncharacterized protein n=1 Tax=Thermofilum pendens TaxID=2269 RepID=A0A7J3X5J7_THEPE